MLKLSEVRVVYGGVVLALNNVSLDVNDGTIVVLLGGNGSGKSTTLKSISGLLKTEEGKINEGSILFDNQRINEFDPEKIARLGICHVMQGHSVFPQLTTEENLLMGAYLRKDSTGVRQDLEMVYSFFPKLVALRRQKSGYLSGGEQQMVVIGRAFMVRPRLMLLDEPSLGLAPKLIIDIFSILKQINQELKITMLIAEQNTATALTVATYGYVLQNGQIGYEGTAATLRDRQQLKNIYMGLNEKGGFASFHRASPE
jgi:branched-chain amino acid transport system ATP-binding protein